MEIPHISIFGIAVSKMNMPETVQYLTDVIQQNKSVHQVQQIMPGQAQPSMSHQVITVNPIMVMTALEHQDYMEVLQNAELIVPDGTGIVWAAKYLGNVKIDRVAGYDLLHELMKVGESHRWRVYLLGTSPEVIEETAARLKMKYPNIEIVGYHHGYFAPEEDERIVTLIQEANPQLLFVASQIDRQEPWIYKYKDRLNIPVMMGVGGSFDVIAGRVKRAPLIFQKLRLEWFYRLMKEPWRYKRMLSLPKFVVKVIRAREKQH